MKKNDLKGGVLIIGSLLWDNDEIRVNWRNKHVSLENKIQVSVPIRYGRISSQKRFGTYTMVFSMECMEECKLGKGYFVPFLSNPSDFPALKAEGLSLIGAEQDKSELTDGYFHWDWGSIVLCINPKTKARSIIYDEAIDSLKQYWKTNYRGGYNPSDYKVDARELPAVSKEGELLIAWPDELDDYDYLIATATKPKISTYPTAQEIAKKMVDSSYYDYFLGNTGNSISTFQDNDINLNLTLMGQKFARVVWHEFGHFVAHHYNKTHFQTHGVKSIEIERKIVHGSLDYEGNTHLVKPKGKLDSPIELKNLAHHIAALVYGCYMQSIFLKVAFEICFTYKESANGASDFAAVTASLSHHNILSPQKGNVYTCIESHFEVVKNEPLLENLLTTDLSTISQVNGGLSTISYSKLGLVLESFLTAHESSYLTFVDKLRVIIDESSQLNV